MKNIHPDQPSVKGRGAERGEKAPDERAQAVGERSGKAGGRAMETRERSKVGGRVAPKRYFGKRLRELRASYYQRLSASTPDQLGLQARPTASSLITCMRQANYEMSTATYSEIENGVNVPRDADSFLTAVARCLRLSQADEDDLAQRLAYDILSIRLGDYTSKVFPPNPDWG